MKDAQLIKVAAGFRKGILKRRKSAAFCFAISAPLASYLNVLGVECDLTEGEVPLGKSEGWEHFWITLKDGRILDPTADQFDKKMPPVYLGPKPRKYKVVKPCKEKP